MALKYILLPSLILNSVTSVNQTLFGVSMSNCRLSLFSDVICGVERR